MSLIKNQKELTVWTDEEVNTLQNLLSKGYIDSEIAVVLGRPRQSVTSKKKKLGLKVNTENAKLQDEMFYENKFIKKIPFSEGYYLDKSGNIYSFWKHNGNQKQFVSKTVQHITKGALQSSGYHAQVINGKTYGVHALMLETFVGPRPEGYVACHRNDVKYDNRLVNLYWGTKSQNALDAKRNFGYYGTGKRISDEKRKEIHSLKNKMTAQEIAKQFNISDKAVYKIFQEFSDGTRKRIPKEVKKEIRSLKNQMTIKEIAKQYNIAERTVYKIFKEVSE